MYTTPQSLSAYLDTPLDCACGHTHYASLRYVSIRSGAVEDLPSILQKLGRSHPYLICDSVTRQIAGDRCHGNSDPDRYLRLSPRPDTYGI